MNKSLLALAALSVLSSAVLADDRVAAPSGSSVTLSGSVDVGVARIDGDTKVQTSTSSRSKFALSGSEDLGGGMKAIFLLEHRFKPNDGTVNPGANISGNQFYRHSYVGLTSAALGTVRLGRIRMPLRDLSVPYSVFGEATVADTATLGGGGNATDRANNAIYYTSPNLYGVQVHAAVAAAEGQTAAPSIERPLGVAVSFNSGPISATIAFDRNDQDLDTKGVYASYDLGMVKVLGQYDETDLSATTKRKQASIGAQVPLGAAVVKASFGKISGDKEKIGVGADYNLSKRTLVYADVAKLRGDGYSATQKKTRADIGIYHKF